ncbi:MAG TPA: phosphotransferase [Candidatus Intestinimonas stercorigallinarum]|nr:phosphotransferase [Candidatus Intestinimonas stercorigallinarum]
MALVEDVPERDTMLHGDYHTNNIVMQNNEVLIIDMDTLSVGHPIFELASMYLAFVAFGEVDPGVTLSFLKLSRKTAVLFWKKALAKYLGTRDGEAIRAVEEKAMVIGYARLMRRTIRRSGLNTEEGRANIELCRTRLADLLSRVDTLLF